LKSTKISFFLQLLLHYPVVAKQLRDYYKKENSKIGCKSDGCSHEHEQAPESHHACGFHAMKNGLGYEDLDRLMKNPTALDFIFGNFVQRLPGRPQTWLEKCSFE
jgi:hypothetical protein